jgi:hypothetical protein
MNKWEQIAKIIGEENGFQLGLSEEFEIEGYRNSPYRFTEEGLFDCKNFKGEKVLVDLIYSVIKIKKLPRKPKYGETYYIPYFSVDCLYMETEWLDTEFDLNCHKFGLIRFSKEETIELAKEIILLAQSR